MDLRHEPLDAIVSLKSAQVPSLLLPDNANSVLQIRVLQFFGGNQAICDRQARLITRFKLDWPQPSLRAIDQTSRRALGQRLAGAS